MIMDVVGELAFGKSFEALHRGPHPFWKWWVSFERKNAIKLLFSRFPTSLVQAVFVACVPEFTKMMKFVHDAIHRRRDMIQNTGKPRRDILQMFLEATDPDTGEKLTDDELAGESLVQLAAGTDTTSNALVWTVYLLLHHPDKYEKLLVEIDAKVPDFFTSLSSKDLGPSDLPYLEAVISESMRVYPPAAGFLPRIVPDMGLVVDGHYIPAGMVVFPGIYAMHRSSRLWSDADSFIPERFLGPDAADLKKNVFTFGGGPRRCIGRR